MCINWRLSQSPWDRAPGSRHWALGSTQLLTRTVLTVTGLSGKSGLVQSRDGEVLSDSPFSLFHSRSECMHTSQHAHQKPQRLLPPSLGFLSVCGVLEHLAPRGQSHESGGRTAKLLLSMSLKCISQPRPGQDTNQAYFIWTIFF